MPLVQKGAQANVNSGTAITASITGVTAGNLLVCTIGIERGTNTTNAIPTPTGGWSVAVAAAGPGVPPTFSAYCPTVAIFYKENVAAGAHSAAFTGFPIDSYGYAEISEYSGVLTASSLDAAATIATGATSGTSATITSGAANAQVDSLVIAVITPEAGAGPGTTSNLSSPAATGYTSLYSDPTNAVITAYNSNFKEVHSSAVQSASWTWTGSSFSARALAVFKMTASGASINPTGIASAEAWGTPGVQPTAAPTGIVSAEAWGTPALIRALSPTGIPSAEAWGTASVIRALTPTGIPSAEAWGVPSLAAVMNAFGIASAEAWGQPVISAGGATLIAVGIPSAEAWGTQALQPRTAPVGIASAEAWGTPLVGGAAGTISAQGIPSAEAWGLPSLQRTLAPTGIASAEAWGLPALTVRAAPTGIPSAEAWGVPRVLPPITINPVGIPSGEAWGSPTLASIVITGPTQWIYASLRPEHRYAVIEGANPITIIRGENRTTKVPKNA